MPYTSNIGLVKTVSGFAGERPVMNSKDGSRKQEEEEPEEEEGEPYVHLPINPTKL